MGNFEWIEELKQILVSLSTLYTIYNNTNYNYHNILNMNMGVNSSHHAPVNVFGRVTLTLQQV